MGIRKHEGEQNTRHRDTGLTVSLRLYRYSCGVEYSGVRFPKATMVASSVITNRVQWNLRPLLANGAFGKRTPGVLFFNRLIENDF